jgi:signal transduction histidine kinase
MFGEFALRLPEIIVAGLAVMTAVFALAMARCKKSLRARIVLSFTYLFMMAAGTLGFINQRAMHQAAEADMRSAMLSSAELTATSIDLFMRYNLDTARTEALLPMFPAFLALPESVRRGSPEELEVMGVLNSLKRRDQLMITSISLLDASGKVAADTDGVGQGLDRHDRAYFFEPMRTGLPHASDVIYSEVRKQPAIFFTSPVRDHSGRIAGVFRIRYNAAVLQRFVTIADGKYGRSATFTLFDENLTYLADSKTLGLAMQNGAGLTAPEREGLVRARRLAPETATPLVEGLKERMALIARQPFFTSPVRPGEQALAYNAAVRLKTKDWFLVMSMSRDEHLAAVISQVTGGALGLAGVTALVVAAMTILANRIARPIEQLTDAANRMKAGRLDVRLDGSGEDETGQLKRAFNEMSEALALSREDLIGVRRYLDAVIDSMPSLIAGVDATCRVTRFNSSAAALAAKSQDEAIGAPIGDVFPFLRGLEPVMMQALSGDSAMEERNLKLVLAGREAVADMLVYPLKGEGLSGGVVRLDDVTTRARMEEVMVQTEKMMSVGGLAAGMAHEINNPLTGILQSAQVIRNRLLKDTPANEEAARDCACALDVMRAFLNRREIPELLDGIRDSAARAARIVANMLQFSRLDVSGREPLDVTAILDRAVDLCMSDYDMKKNYDFRKIIVEREYEPGLPPVACAANQIEQVILNLLKNAAQSMARGAANGKPRIVLRASREDGHAVIQISDNGPGMDENTRRRAFEPFYTTKPPGEGTGLGLSVSYFIIVDKHGGSIRVDSAPGRGATFTITLPLALSGTQAALAASAS